MMEGVAQEAASLAGHLQLDNLCWIYDNNEITIEGSTGLAFSDDIATKFIGLGWNVTHVDDANDRGMLARAFETFKAEAARPTLIIVDSRIGYGAPTKEGSHSAHGEPLGAEEVRGTKRFYGWPEDATFLVPDEVYRHFADGAGSRGRGLRGGVGVAVHPLYRGVSRAGRPARPDAAAAAAGRVGRRHPRLRARRQGPGRAETPARRC